MIITKKKKKKSEDIAPVFSEETKQAIKETAKSTVGKAIEGTSLERIKNIWSNGYQVGDITNTVLNAKSIFDPATMVRDQIVKTAKSAGNMVKSADGNFLKSSKTKENLSNIWDDGYQFGDVAKSTKEVTKTILGTTGDVAANLAKGELQTAEGLVDTGRYVVSDVAKLLGADKYSANVKERAKQNTTGFIFGENDEFNNPKENGWAKKLDEYSVFDNKMDQIVQSVGQQGFRVGLQGAIGMTGASEGTVEALNKLEIFAGSYGTAKSEALANGASDRDATIRGVISGTAEYISENLFDSLPGFKTGEAAGVSKLKSIIGESAEKTFGKGAGKVILRVFGAAGEGFEEILSNGLETAGTDIVNLIASDYNYGMQEGQGLNEDTFIKNAAKLFKDVYGSAFSKESGEAFVSAFFSTLITGAISDGMTQADRRSVIKAYAKDNNISEEQATKLFDGIRDLRTKQVTNANDTFETKSNIQDQISRQLSQEIKNNKDLNLQELQEGLINRDKFIQAVGTGVVSSEGLDLLESYKAYNGDSKYNNEIANIQKFMNNRNIDARFDATMFENAEQNAIWTTQDGKDAVVFNPKATQDQVIQSIATHEMTHDIMAQKTETGTSLFNDVLETIKSQKDYAQKRAEIEELYAKYYDKNSKDFAAKVDEEMVANELGENLGTQEYINRLVNEKPSVARRIYNWVIDKLDNIGKSAEYKEQKAYWKSVADKFEKAYNEQKTATGEDKTAYSMVGKEGIETAVYSTGKHQELIDRYNRALELSKNKDYSNEMIRQETGWFQNKNGNWEYEINDSNSKLTQSLSQNSEYYLGDIFEHKALYKMYPELIDLKVKTSNIKSNGRMDADNGIIYINNNNKNIKSTLLHEIQHYIQRVEGFPTGTAIILGNEQYANNLGEIEAADTTKRINYTDEQRNDIIPESAKENPTHPNREKILNRKRNIVEKAVEKVYNNLNEKQNKKISTKINDENNSLGRLNKNVDNTFFSLNQNYRGSHQIENAKSITELNLDDVKNKVIEIDGYLTNQAQSDLKKLQKILNNSDEKVKIYRAAPVNELNNGDWVTTDKSYAQNVAQNNGGKVYTYEVNANQLLYPDNVRDLPSLHRLSSFQYNGENINNNQTRYSLTLSESNTGKDNNGRTLSKEQVEYFKDSKATDENGDLVTVYHTMTNVGNQFNEFNPVGTDYYRFGEQVVNYFTDNQDMSGSYADQEYKKAYTKPINNMQDVQDFLDFQNTQSDSLVGVNGITNHYNIEKNGDGYVVKQIPSGKEFLSNVNLSDEGKVALDRVKNNENLHNQFLGTEDYISTLKNQLEEWYNTRQYDGYPELAQMLDVYKRETTKLIGQTDTYGKQSIIKNIFKNDLENYLFGTQQFATEKVNQVIDNNMAVKFANEQELINNIQNEFKAKYQYAGYLNMTNPYVIETLGENWDSILRETNQARYDEYQRVVNSQEIKNKLYELAQESEKLNREYRQTNQERELSEMALAKNKINNSELRETINDLGMFNFNYEEWIEAGKKNAEMFGEEFKTNLPDGNELIVNYMEDLNPAEQEIVKDMTISEFVSKYGKLNEENNKFGDASSYFKDQFKKVTGTNLDTNNIGYKNMYDLARYNFDAGSVQELLEDRLTTNDLVKRIIEKNKTDGTNYDGLIMKDVYDYGGQSKNSYRTTGNIYVTFNSNQFKAVDNLNPTQDADIRYSMQQQEAPTTPGTRTTIGELFDRNIAPIREDLSNITEQMNNLSNQLETMQESLENTSESTNRGYVEPFREQRYENQSYTPLTEQDAELYQNALMNDEGYLKSIDQEANLEQNQALINKLSDEVQNILKLTTKEKATLQNLITDAVDNQLNSDEILKKLNREFALKKAKLDNDALFEDAADYIHEGIVNDFYNTQLESQASLDKDIQFNMTEDIAPTTIRSQESIDEMIDNRDIAPVRQDTQKPQSQIRERLETMRRKWGEMVTNRNYEIDKVAQLTGNNEIKFSGDNLNNVSGETQFNINNSQTDVNGKWVGKGLHKLFEGARNEGLADAYNDYLYHKSNVERHNVGKGSEIPLAVSQQLVAKYEQQYPQVKEWARELYKFEDNLLQEQVDSGIISQEKYNDYRGEHGIYRSYVPFYEARESHPNITYDDEGNIKAYSTLKRSKGGATDVSGMLSMEEAIARQVYASKKAIRENELYKEIVSSLDKYDDMMSQDIRDNPTNLEDSLYITPDGEKVLSAYFNGEKISAKISEELYNELARTNENRIKQIEEDFSLITNPLQKISSVRRNVLTTWNPTFLARNAIKDIQDAVINSKYTGDMLANYFGTKKGSKSAISELSNANTETAQQFLALYGADNLYGDYSNVTDGKVKSQKGINKFARINELIELAPRYAEFKATLQNGGTVNEAIYNAREVTTNFGRGGYITKALNRNGFTFLNANVQGLDKVIRNLSGENGVKGVTSVIAKGAAFAVLPSILNHLLYGSGDDKDEEYDALPDYIKDNYYLVKLMNGKFLRIPKGRINAVFGSLARRTIEAMEGEENAYESWGSNAWSQIGVGDSSGLQTVFTPITQAINNEAWYGGDIVPTRLQNKPAAEQTDASIDALSNFIGKTLNISPYKVNYVIDQYSGGLGDVLLPMMTEETTSGAETPIDYLTAPVKDAFIVNSIDDNKYASEFYNMKDKLQIKSNSQYATDEDKIRYKYMSNMSSRMSDLYAERREVQADTTLSNKEKYAKVQAIQKEINALAKEAMNSYNNFTSTDSYVSVGDVEYYKNDKGEWTKVNDSDSEFTAGMTDSEKTSYYNVKNKIGDIVSTYNNNIKDINDDNLKAQYQSQKRNDITQAIVHSGLDNYSKAMVYSKYYSSADTMKNVANAGYNVDTYITALQDIEELRTKYSQKNGYSTEQRKQKTIAYINSLDMNIPQKAMLIRNYYSSFRSYNTNIVEYVNSLNIPYEDKKAILEGTGMTVNGNKISWK